MPSGGRIHIDGVDYLIQNAGKPWSFATPDADTVRFEVRPGDRWQDDPNTRERSELSGGDAVYAAGSTLTVSYDFMIEPGAANTAQWVVAGQFHANDDWSPPPFAVELLGEKMTIVIRYVLPGEDDPTRLVVYEDDSNFKRGHYYNIDITVKFGVNGKGFLDVTRDGTQIVDYDGPIGYGDGVYWKYGIYREDSGEVLAANFKNFSLKSSGSHTPEGGVKIIGTKAADLIDSDTSPNGQPTVTEYGDIIRGIGGSDQAFASGGNDKLIMGRGDDLIDGGLGNDLLKGGKGNDRLVGGSGDDLLKGGKGNDTFSFANGFGDDTIKGFRPGKDKIAFDDNVFANFADLRSAAAEHDGGLTIDAGDSSVFLSGIRMNQIDDSEFLFT